jgi:Holliday junction resolvase RusA-like endonuclease
MKSQMHFAMESDDPERSVEAQDLKLADVFFVEMEFYITPPISLSTSQRSNLLWVGSPTVKPDIDNLVKFYLDAGNNILWSDDKKIVELKATKIYSESPQTIIKVTGKKLMATNEKVQGILGVFPPNRYYEMLKDLTFLAEMEGKPNRSQQNKAADAAYILSKFADNYSDELRKIKKNFPGYWQDCISKETVDKKSKRS